MIGLSRCIAERVRFNFEDLSGRVGEWVTSAFGPLQACAHKEVPTEITIRFVDRIAGSVEPLSPLPLGALEDGIALVDHLGRRAIIRFPLSESEIEVERDIDPWFFHRWIYMPLLRAALWQHRIALVHAAAVECDGKRIAFSGWAGAGKSPLALRMLSEGASLVGDDWIALAEDGTSWPVTAHLNLNTWHAAHLERSPVIDRPWLRRAGAIASWAAHLVKRFPKASMGFSLIATSARAAGKTKISVSELFPGTAMASTGRLDHFYFLPMPGMGDPSPRDFPEMVVASGRSELLYMEDLENTIRFAFPQMLGSSLFGSHAEESAVVAAGMFSAHRAVIRSDGSPGHTRRIVARIRRGSSRAPGASEVA